MSDDLHQTRHGQHYDDADRIAQHQRIAMRDLHHPGKPERGQQQKCEPVPDARQPVAEPSERTNRSGRGAYHLPHRLALLNDDNAEEYVIGEAECLQQRVVRSIRQAQKQPDFRNRITENGHHHEQPGPACGVGGCVIRDMQQSHTRLARREHHACDAQDRRAQTVGIDGRQQHEPRQIVATQRTSRDQMAADQKTEHRQHLENEPAEHQRHTTQQHQCRDTPMVGRLDLSPFGARLAAFVHRRAAVRRLADQRQDRPSDGGTDCPFDRKADDQYQRQAPRRVEQDTARPRVGRGNPQPVPQHRHAADSPQRADHLAGQVGQETRGTHQHRRPQTVRHQRARRLPRRLGCGGRGSRGGLGRRRGRRSCDHLQGRGDLRAFLRIVQHLQRPARIVRTDLGRGSHGRTCLDRGGRRRAAAALGGWLGPCGQARRERHKAGEKRQSQHRHGSEHDRLKLVNKMAR